MHEYVKKMKAAANSVLFKQKGVEADSIRLNNPIYIKKSR